MDEHLLRLAAKLASVSATMEDTDRRKGILSESIEDLHKLAIEDRKRSEAPPWLTVIWEIVEWVTIILCINAYIYRSGRTGVKQHTSSVDNAFRINQLVKERFSSDKKLRIFFGSSEFNPNIMQEKRDK